MNFEILQLVSYCVEIAGSVIDIIGKIVGIAGTAAGIITASRRFLCYPKSRGTTPIKRKLIKRFGLVADDAPGALKAIHRELETRKIAQKAAKNGYKDIWSMAYGCLYVGTLIFVFSLLLIILLDCSASVVASLPFINHDNYLQALPFILACLCYFVFMPSSVALILGMTLRVMIVDNLKGLLFIHRRHKLARQYKKHFEIDTLIYNFAVSYVDNDSDIHFIDASCGEDAKDPHAKGIEIRTSLFLDIFGKEFTEKEATELVSGKWVFTKCFRETCQLKINDYLKTLHLSPNTVIFVYSRYGITSLETARALVYAIENRGYKCRVYNLGHSDGTRGEILQKARELEILKSERALNEPWRPARLLHRFLL